VKIDLQISTVLKWEDNFELRPDVTFRAAPPIYNTSLTFAMHHLNAIASTLLSPIYAAGIINADSRILIKQSVDQSINQ